MPEKTANPSKQPEPEKKADAVKLPHAPPKQEKPPDQSATKSAASAPADKTAAAEKSADKAAAKQPATTPESKKPDVKSAAAVDPKVAEKADLVQPKVTAQKSQPTAEQKKTAASTKAAAKAIDANKTEAKAPVKPAKPEAPIFQKPTVPTEKNTDSKAAPKSDEEKSDIKTMAAPITASQKAAAPLHDPGESKGVRVTQIFDDRLEYPDEKALNSLPIPKEGEGYSMRLHPAYFYQFLDHPFTVNREVKDYIELYESIRDNGINEPVKARPRANGGLELISGHRRHDIAKQLNYPVPVIIAQVDDDTARVEVVDGNLHRMDIPTSELARAAKMKMEALARKAGRRSKMDVLSDPTPKKRTDQIVAEDMGISRNQVNRLVRINELVPELKQQVDEKKLPFNTAVELSFMKPDEQNKVVDLMKKEQITPSMAQATALKEASRHADTIQKNMPSLAPSHKVDENKIASIMKPKKEPEVKVTFTGAELKEFFPNAALSVPEVKRVVFEALSMRQKIMNRQEQKKAIKNAPEH